jgi:phosphohistidine phosphatase SixA
MGFSGRLHTILLALFFTGLLAGCAKDYRPAPSYHSSAGTTTTVILTRHGDRDAASNLLNEKGRVRAQALVGEIGEMNITAIYCPDLVRNIDTARPLAKHLGLKIETFSDMSKVHEVLETIMSRHSGDVILWVGNTSNLPLFYSRLGGEGEPPTKYGDLFIIKLKGEGFPEVIKKRYGPVN